MPASDVESAIEVEMRVDLASLGAKLATNQAFLALVRTNQLMRARTQSSIYGRYAQQHEPVQQTRKLY